MIIDLISIFTVIRLACGSIRCSNKNNKQSELRIDLISLTAMANESPRNLFILLADSSNGRRHARPPLRRPILENKQIQKSKSSPDAFCCSFHGSRKSVLFDMNMLLVCDFFLCIEMHIPFGCRVHRRTVFYTMWTSILLFPIDNHQRCSCFVCVVWRERKRKKNNSTM